MSKSVPHPGVSAQDFPLYEILFAAQMNAGRKSQCTWCDTVISARDVAHLHNHATPDGEHELIFCMCHACAAGGAVVTPAILRKLERANEAGLGDDAAPLVKIIEANLPDTLPFVVALERGESLRCCSCFGWADKHNVAGLLRYPPDPSIAPLYQIPNPLPSPGLTHEVVMWCERCNRKYSQKVIFSRIDTYVRTGSGGAK